MSKWTGYFKIVTPQQSVTKMTDSQEMADVGAYNNYTWYQRLIQGSASRMTRYREYDLMDNDVEVARALDTLAEEMTGNNPKTKEPLLIDILSEDEENIENVAVLTLKAALRRWCELNDFSQKLFNIARLMVKYGDVFFKRGKKIGDPWQFIHPKNVVAAIVAEDDITKIVAWQVKKDMYRPKSGGYSMPLGAKKDTEMETEIILAKDIIRFTLSDDMSDTHPFGESVLRPVYRAHKQKELLEDAIIIYRIQRAPERRVFYIDVGKMPPQKVKQYLEGIKNEIKQKKIPTLNGGQQEVDTVYNPHSMCLALDTKIPLLDGRTLTLKEMISEYENGKENWVYSINPETGEVVPGIVSWAGITQRNAETIKLILDNGEEIVCTPEHKFPIQGKGFVEAKDITPNDSLYPFKTRKTKINPTQENCSMYEQYYNPATKGWNFTHRMVGNYMKSLNMHNEYVYLDEYKNEPKTLIHHISFNSMDNSPNNLAFMSYRDHSLLHQNFANNQEVIFSNELFDIFESLVIDDIKTIKFKEVLERVNNSDEFMSLYRKLNQPKKGKKYKIKTDKMRQKMFLKFIKTFGYNNWRDYKQSKIQENVNFNNIKKAKKYGEDDIKLLQYLINLIKNVSINRHALIRYLKENVHVWNNFCELYEKVFSKTQNMKNRHNKLSVPEYKVFERIAKYFNYNDFNHLVDESSNFNHRVVKIEKHISQDVGTLTIDGDEIYHNYHTFALSHCFTKNSEDFFFASRPDGRGSRVETLPGGQGLGELADLDHFQRKVWRGLKVPTSYMIEQQEGGQIWNDGKVGIAYIQELRFSLYIQRLQGHMEKTLDKEFKKFLKDCNIIIDENMYRVVLPEPSNFGKYRQLELDSQLLSAYTTADGISYLSPRFALKRFLQMTDEELAINERLKREELGLDVDSKDPKDLQILYGSEEQGMGAGGVGGIGGIGGGFGGVELGMGEEPEGGAEEGGAEATGTEGGIAPEGTQEEK